MTQAVTSRPPAPQPKRSAVPRVPAEPRTRSVRVLILVAGVVVTHLILFAPSLLGWKVLLPLDQLSFYHVYLPPDPAYKDVHPTNRALSDQVLQFELQRRFAAAEIRAGRVPLWNPYHFCGAPFAFPTFSPFILPYYLFPYPITEAWSHVLAAVVAAAGAYVFFRRVLGVGFWPAVVIAWCYPLTGCFQLWLGFFISYTFPFFPWLLVAVDSAVRRPGGWGGPVLGLVTALTLLSGAVDIAGQTLLACGLFSLWRLGERYYRERQRRPVVAGVAALSAGWMAGILLASISLSPLFEYLPTGLRTQSRARSSEERPPVGITGTPQMFLPLFYGSTARLWPWMARDGNLQEGGAQAYAGLVAAFVLAPLAFARRRYLSINIFWVLLALVSAAWYLDVPVLTHLLRLPGLNLMSHNRFLFVFAFATLALAVVGLDALVRGEVAWHFAYVVPVLVLIGLGLLSAQRGADVRDVVTRRIVEVFGLEGRTRAEQQATFETIQGNFQRASFISAGMCAAAVGLWVLVVRGPRGVTVGLVSLALIAELLWFARDQNLQSDPELYYPTVPALAELAQKPPGRITGMACLPPLLPQAYGLRDVRGYDAVDPARIVELLDDVRDMQSGRIPYALTQYWVPVFPAVSPTRARVLPVVSMLNLRYVIGRGKPPDELRPIIIERDDYWVYENGEFMPRVYIPARVKVMPEDEILRTIAGRVKQGAVRDPATGRIHDNYGMVRSAIDFDPAKIAYTPTDPGLADADAKGTAKIVDENPLEIRVAVDMETPGLLVLADQWYAGWHAYLDGKECPVLPVNRAIRGVALPAGRGELVFRYEPAGWTRGLRMAAIAASALACWAAALAWLGRRKRVAVPSA